ncbi:uncharacterized protein [Musca autumnalis]|uniref:uncharacterized protein n=1 Tax=Musca autumnalis TaxID=221902 RepID=UPI003CFA8EF8
MATTPHTDDQVMDAEMADGVCKKKMARRVIGLRGLRDKLNVASNMGNGNSIEINNGVSVKRVIEENGDIDKAVPDCGAENANAEANQGMKKRRFNEEVVLYTEEYKVLAFYLFSTATWKYYTWIFVPSI